MFSIGQVSKQIGIKIPTIRYYEEIELIVIETRSSGNQRQYSNKDVERLSFIKHARELGFSIESIRQFLELASSQLDSCIEIDQLASQQLSETRSKIKNLKKLEKELTRMLAGCKAGEINECYVIQSLSNHDLCENNH